MAKLLALTAALFLAASRASADSAAAQLGLPGLRFQKSRAGVQEVLPTAGAASRPWIKATPDALTIDLRGQFDPLTRRQWGYGTCAAFAAVAVAEAAADRVGGRCVRLSEADLYLEGNVLHWDCWKDPRKDCKQNVQGANVWGLLNEIVQVGVLQGDDYKRFMDVYQKALDDDHALANGPPPARRHPWLSLLTSSLDWDYVLGRWDDTLDVRGELTRYASASRGGDLVRARREVARMFAGYRILRGKAEYVKDRWEMKPGTECAERGKAAARFIDGELIMGRPVGVGMYLSGLKEWPTDAKGEYSGHGFVIVGLTLRRDKDGVKKVYHTRNSWPAQPDIPAEQLCRVNDVVSLLGPRESEAPANPWALLR